MSRIVQSIGNASVIRRRAARVIALTATLAAAAVLAAGPLAADAQNRQRQRQPQGVLIAVLLPFSGQSERGMLNVHVRRDSSRIIGVLIALAVDPGDPSGDTYALNFSTRSCRALRREPSDQGFVAQVGLDTAELDADDRTAYLEEDNVFRARDLRGVKSVALTVPAGSGNDEIQACGRVRGYKLADILISS